MAIGAVPSGYISPGTEWDIQIAQNTDDTFQFSFADGPVPYVLTGYTFTFYLKTSSNANDASAYQNSPTVTSPLLGQILVAIPHTEVTIATNPAAPLFYHVDGTENSSFPDVTNFVFGTVSVIPA